MLIAEREKEKEEKKRQ